MNALFVTATGTEIGKTFITCALVHQLRARNIAVRAIKPVVSGFDERQPQDSDCAQLLAAQGLALAEHLDDVSPWRFGAALAPDMAAALEQRQVDFEALVGFCREAADSRSQLIIEGIGGALVPLDETHTVLDWIVALDVPTLLVTGSYLGTISHTLSTCAAMTARDVHIQAVLVSESSGSAVDLDATCTSLRRFLPGLDVLPIDRVAGPEPWRGAPNLLAVAGLLNAPTE